MLLNRVGYAWGLGWLMIDVHATKDGVVLMFHDPTLDRTTDGKGMIRNQNWHGQIEYVSLQSIPLLTQDTFVR